MARSVAATGVWVVDTKRYTGKVQVAKPLFGKPTLTIAGRDQTKLVGGLAKQVDLVAAALADLDADVPIHGCFCFVDSELPLFGHTVDQRLRHLRAQAPRQATQRPRRPSGRARRSARGRVAKLFPSAWHARRGPRRQEHALGVTWPACAPLR